MAAWLRDDAAPDCDHRPDLYGSRCELCGLPADPRPVPGSAAERWDRDELARELESIAASALARIDGQSSWLG